MSVAKRPRPKPRRWGRGPNPLILKRRPRRDPEPPEPVAAGRVDYSREQAAFARVRADLLERHPGKFVVFVGDEMIGPFDNFPIALREAYQTFGRRPIYAKELIPDDSVR